MCLPQALPSTPLPDCTPTSNDCCQKPFSTGSIIIPLDRCHQPLSGPKQPAGPTTGPSWCYDSPSGSATGQMEVYGLTFRLLQAGIPAHFMINPTKSPQKNSNMGSNAVTEWTDKDIDFWVIGSGCTTSPPTGVTAPASLSAACLSPVSRYQGAGTTGTAYSRGSMPLRNALIIEAGADATRFVNYMRLAGEFSAYSSAIFSFPNVYYYVMQPGATLSYQDYRTTPSYAVMTNRAPVGNRMDYAPPKIAHVPGSGAPDMKFMEDSKLAGLAGTAAPATCATSSAAWPKEAVYCDVTQAQVNSGTLLNYGFNYVWLHNWTAGCTAAGATTMAKLAEFLTAVPGSGPGARNAGNAFFQGVGPGGVETCNAWPAGTFTRFTNTGLDLNGGPMTEPIIFRYPANILTQLGDMVVDFQTGSGGAKFDTYSGAYTGYKAAYASTLTGTLRRLMTQETAAPNCTGHSATSVVGCDQLPTAAGRDHVDGAVYARYNNDPNNGLMFYAAGNNVNGQTYAAHQRMLLNTLLTLPSGTVPVVTTPVAVVPVEVARSSSVTTEVGTSSGLRTAQMLGTYGVYNPPLASAPTYVSGAVGSFYFPAFYGHMRAFDPTSLTASGTAYASATAFWDANTYLENLSTDSRVIFTNTTTGTNPTRVSLTAANSAALYALLGVASADATTLIAAVRRGHNISSSQRARLGGVDRSTPAVVEASPQTATDRQRPRMVYFGALDGQLHAICGETNASYGCSQPGHELWSFIPRTQLGRLRLNTSRIDGSPKVADVFDDFNADGTKEFHTILTFQTAVGSSGTDAPSAYGLDITNPANPIILWERVLNGPGLNMALGPVRVGAVEKNLVFIASSVGSGAGALELAAVDARTGVAQWSVTRTNTLSAPNTALPGGVAAVDNLGESQLTDVIATNVDGRIYRFNAGTGAVPAGVADPIFRFSDAAHAIAGSPTIWKDSSGNLHALVATGGYVDNTAYTTVWSPLGTNQFVLSVPIARATTLVATGTGATPSFSAGTPDFAVSYGTTSRSFSQVTVAGGTFYLVTDSDIEPNAKQYGLTANTGRLQSGRLNAVPALGTARTLGGGTGAAEVAGGVVNAGGGTGGVEKETGLDTGQAATAGTELIFDVKTARQLWLRLQ